MTDAAATPEPGSAGRAASLLCLVVLLVGAWLGLRAAVANGVTYDEVYYLRYARDIAGGGSPCKFTDHPPLAKWLTTAGIRAGLDPAPPWVRVPQLLLYVGFGLLVASWSRTLYGWSAALAATVLFAFSPNVLAHASLATTDFPLTVVYVTAVWLLRGFLLQPTFGRALLWSIGLAAALLTKLTVLVLLPAGALVAALLFVAGGVRMRRAHLWGLVLPPIAFVALGWAAYGFDTCAVTAFHQSIRIRLAQNATGNGVSVYALGHVYATGVWWYYLLTTALKEPLPFLVLLAAAAVFRPRPHGGQREVAVLLVPAACLFVAASASVHQLGHRYVLPLFPLLVVWVSGLAADARGARAALVWTALVLYGADSLRIAPHYLAYMNQLIGGPDNAYHYLADSNLDWKQDANSPDIARLRARWNVLDLKRTPLDLRSTKPPALLLGGTELSGVWVSYGFWGTPFTRLVRERGYRPADRVGFSLFLFPVDSMEIYRDLRAWIRLRSWVDAANLDHRLAPTLGLAEPDPPAVAPHAPLDDLPCEGGPQRVRGGAAWEARWRVEEPGEYLFEAPGRAALSIWLNGVPLPVERGTDPKAPTFAPVRLERGLYALRISATRAAAGGRLPLAIARLARDASGHRTAVSLNLPAALCPEGVPLVDRRARCPGPRTKPPRCDTDGDASGLAPP